MLQKKQIKDKYKQTRKDIENDPFTHTHTHTHTHTFMNSY